MTQYGPDVQRMLIGRRFDASALKMFQAGGDADGDGSAILAHIDTLVWPALIRPSSDLHTQRLGGWSNPGARTRNYASVFRPESTDGM